MRVLIVFGTALLLAVGMLFNPTLAENDKGDAIARELAERMWKGMVDRDLEKVMKLVDVPWCHDGREIILEKETLRGKFQEQFRNSRDLSKAKMHIRKIAPLLKYLAEGKGPPRRKSSLGDVLGDDNRVVFLEIEHNGRFEGAWLGVRLNKMQGKVVGVID